MVVKAGPGFGRLLSQKHIIFLFQAAWNWQLTNEVRFHRNLSHTSLCARCGCQVESVHLLFDSYWARQLWMKLLPSSKVPNFFQGDTMVWLECMSNGGRNPRYWIWLFVSISICWTIWKACNKVVIDGVLINMPEQVRQVKQLIRGYSLAFSLPSGSVSSRAAELVSWKVPDVDWWKLNVDGSVLATSGAAGIGGLIRELSGQWITYFSCFNGPSSIIFAELPKTCGIW